jgi:hypothetical protein
MNQTRATFPAIIVKTAVTHSITYFVVGVLAATLLNYGRFFEETNLGLMMRKLNDPWVMAGPLFQPIRGVLFGLVFYLLREPFFSKKGGWLTLWMVLVVVGILGTFGPTPGSLEGMIYTLFPLGVHLKGLPEVLLQSLLLSAVLFYWVNHPGAKWLNWFMGVVFVILMVAPVLGLLAR